MLGDQHKQELQGLLMALEPMLPHDHLPFLAHLEQKAKREGILEYLRVIRNYRRIREAGELHMYLPPFRADDGI